MGQVQAQANINSEVRSHSQAGQGSGELETSAAAVLGTDSPEGAERGSWAMGRVVGGPRRVVRPIAAWWCLAERRKTGHGLPNPFSPFSQEILMLEFQSQEYQNEDHVCNFTSEPLCMCILMQYFITQSHCFLCFLLLSSASSFRMDKVYEMVDSSVFFPRYLTGTPRLYFSVPVLKLTLRKHFIYSWDPSLQMSGMGHLQPFREMA